ncbi:hypothetical protein CDAR_218421 [Caerostris darwini]|uniref:Uncharacterized protein n=1 Tax=Caerostris darwini TaxID=1538125 RepID=A0AAV4RIV2_9ARAC|nr:hypothetical protein CDAR_218421 [Caerostris darwini]
MQMNKRKKNERGSHMQEVDEWWQISDATMNVDEREGSHKDEVDEWKGSKYKNSMAIQIQEPVDEIIISPDDETALSKPGGPLEQGPALKSLFGPERAIGSDKYGLAVTTH